MNSNRKALSFFIAFIAMANIVLLCHSINLQQQQEDEYVVELAVIEEEVEELLEEEQKLLNQNNTTIKSHLALNETAKRTYGSPEPLKSLDEILEEREMNSEESDLLSSNEGFEAHLKELSKKRQEKREQLGDREAEKKHFTDYLKERRTSISFSLVDRNGLNLPPPIYTCFEGGKVVVNIKVDGKGNVLEASFNKSSSNTNDYCLIENAITYARKASFSSSSKAEQIGTITYLFQSKGK